MFPKQKSTHKGYIRTPSEKDPGKIRNTSHIQDIRKNSERDTTTGHSGTPLPMVYTRVPNVYGDGQIFCRKCPPKMNTNPIMRANVM